MARQLVIELVGEASKFVKSLDQAENASKSFGEKVEGVGKKMTAFASVPIIGFLGASTKAAMDDAAAQEHLATTLGNTVGNSQRLVTQVEGYITAAQRASTFTDDDLRPAYEALLTTTRDVEQSHKLLNVAMDVAAGKGIDLQTATMAVAKAQEGNFAAVNKLVPGLIDMSDKTLTAEDAVAKLAATFNGQAQGATETTAGKMQILKRDLGEASEAMGAKLLPVLTGFADFATKTLLPTLDSLSGGNGAFVLMAAALAGPVLTALTNVKTAVVALDTALKFLAANPVMLFLTSLVLALNDIQARMRSVGDEGLKLSNILKGIPGSGLSVITGIASNLLGFADGGVVPGPVGAPQLAVVHGGETVVPFRGAQSAGTTVTTGGTTVIQLVLDGRVVAEVVRDRLLQKQRTTPLGFVS